MQVRYDSDLVKETDRIGKQYRDLNLKMTKNSTTGDLVKLSDSQSIKRSLSHLIKFNTSDKPFHPEISSQVRNLLFEPIDGITSNILVRMIENVINNYEPRVILAGVRVLPNPEENLYQVLVDFYIDNAPADLESIEIILERLR